MSGQPSQHSINAPPSTMMNRLSMNAGGSARSGDEDMGFERVGRDGERRRGGRRGERERLGAQERERDKIEEEISTIFVVGFPEDMTVSSSSSFVSPFKGVRRR